MYYKSQSHCTENYYRHTLPGLMFTDGVRDMAERLACYWFLDCIGSYVPEIRGKDHFFVCRVHRLPDGGAKFVIDDGNRNMIIRQCIEYTDIPENVKVYIQDNGHHFIACMPEEY